MADEYSRYLARVATAQLAEVAGFESAQESALDILGDLLVRYISSLAAGAHDYAELAGRTEANLADLVLSMADLGVTPDELNQYARLSDQEVPFAHVVAPYPILRQQLGPPTFLDQGEAPPPAVPAFLPAFPDAHTHQATPSFQGHETDPAKQRQALLQGRQQAEAALVKLHQRLASSAGAGSGPSHAANPFLAPPVVAPATGAFAAVAPRGAAASNGVDASLGAGAGDGGGDDDSNMPAQFDTRAAQRAFGAILPKPAPVDGARGMGSPAPMDEDGGWVGWVPDREKGAAPLQHPGFSLYAGAAEHRNALGLAAARRPQDAYAERAKAALEAGSGTRQRKSKYDTDARARRVEEILSTDPDAFYRDGGGGDDDGGGTGLTMELRGTGTGTGAADLEAM